MYPYFAENKIRLSKKRSTILSQTREQKFTYCEKKIHPSLVGIISNIPTS